MRCACALLISSLRFAVKVHVRECFLSKITQLLQILNLKRFKGTVSRSEHAHSVSLNFRNPVRRFQVFDVTNKMASTSGGARTDHHGGHFKMDSLSAITKF